MSKPQIKPVLAGFNWAESLKKAEQEGTTQKAEGAPSPLKAAAETNTKSSMARQKQVGAKPQQRLRVKV